MHRSRPECKLRGDALRRCHQLRSELGLGPAAKSKVSASQKTEDNPFGKLG